MPDAVRDDKIAQTPPMGWNSWNAYSCAVTEQDIRDAADALVDTGLRDVGYEYLVIDDCWMTDDTDPNGRLRSHPVDFPSGIGDLADYIHNRGLHFGIYSSAGTETCQGYPASLGRERLHAEQFAEWGVDYLKYDNCGDHDGCDAITRYAAMGNALRQTDRDIVYSICEWGLNGSWKWGRNVGGHLWRTTGDIVAKWRAEDDEFGNGLIQIIDRIAELDIADYQAPGGWNDPDMLQVGNGPDSGQSKHEAVMVQRPFTEAEERTHFSFWCMFGAPLMVGTDLRNLSETTHDILTNEQAIAVNQDPLGIQATRDRIYGSREVWSKRLVNGEVAVLLFNRGEETTEVHTHIEEVGVPVTANRYHIHDLWTDEEWETSGELSDTIKPHGVTMVRVSPAE